MATSHPSGPLAESPPSRWISTASAEFLGELITGCRCCDTSQSDFDFLMWMLNKVCIGMAATAVDTTLEKDITRSRFC